jgi:anti-anti-sigma factor|uniref:Anti-sigma factor antagonist n=1 Tax=uncultured bacterium contig00106 TaxID=1181572 RepID=A0A806KPN1_9BACT|nr:anti-sigma-factor antagonist [uncultured bacterium contig00106]
MLEETIKIASAPIEEQPGCFLLTLEGELDSSNAQDVIKHVLNMIENNGMKHLLADLAKLRYINSTGLGAILRISKTIAAKSGNFMIVGPNDNVFEIIEIVGANKLLDIYSTKEEALSSLKS